MKQTYCFLPILVFSIMGIVPVSAQTSTQGRTQTVAPNILPDVRSPSSEYPLWVQDIRRGEIVAFGSFPFTLFISTFAMDSVRFFKNDMNRAYLPWPFKGPGALEMTREEKKQTFMIAVTASITIAVIDFAIVKLKRHREARREQMRDSGGDIHVTRSPITGNTDTAANPEEPPPEEKNP
ncbi:MAG: hypothetical protein LBD96_05610 [Treponema sp.]|nr:hypothetical protein [Treponema sp.]